MRHGQSVWNKEKRFTGWIDVGLSDDGKEECRRAAAKMRDIRYDIAYTSALRRTIESLAVIEQETGWHAPHIQVPALNERHYGILQGMKHEDARKRFGQEQVEKWRRGFPDRPPAGESLADVHNRVIPFFMGCIVPLLEQNKTVFLLLHGNTLRALLMDIENIDANQISSLEIATATPRVYRFTGRNTFLPVNL